MRSLKFLKKGKRLLKNAFVLAILATLISLTFSSCENELVQKYASYVIQKRLDSLMAAENRKEQNNMQGKGPLKSFEKKQETPDQYFKRLLNPQSEKDKELRENVLAIINKDQKANNNNKKQLNQNINNAEKNKKTKAKKKTNLIVEDTSKTKVDTLYLPKEKKLKKLRPDEMPDFVTDESKVKQNQKKDDEKINKVDSSQILNNSYNSAYSSSNNLSENADKNATKKDSSETKQDSENKGKRLDVLKVKRTFLLGNYKDYKNNKIMIFTKDLTLDLCDSATFYKFCEGVEYAKANHRTPVLTTFSTITGFAGGVVPLFAGFLLPATENGVVTWFDVEINENRIPQKELRENKAFIIGYKEQAKRQRFKRTFLGAAAGFVLGVTIKSALNYNNIDSFDDLRSSFKH